MIQSKEICEFALHIAKEASKILKGGYLSRFNTTSKSSFHDVVTEYDLKADKYLVEAIHQKYPTHSILSEESGESHPSNSSVHWIIDPLDGTNNFAHGIPMFAVSIAATLNGELLCGAIVSPITDEAFHAEKGKGAFLNGRPIQVSKTDKLNHAFLAVGFPYNIETNPLHCIEQFTASLKRGMPLRRMGSAAIDLAYVAAGRFDGYWETVLSPWDFAAGILIVEEAGGKVSQLSGSKNSLNSKNSIVASNGVLHEELLSHLKTS